MDPGRNTERRRVITEALEVVLPSVRSTGNFLFGRSSQAVGQKSTGKRREHFHQEDDRSNR